MFSSNVSFNPSVMTSTVLRTQALSVNKQETTETNNVYTKDNVEVSKKVAMQRILPANDVNVIYVASAFHSLPPTERPLKSLWA